MFAYKHDRENAKASFAEALYVQEKRIVDCRFTTRAVEYDFLAPSPNLAGLFNPELQEILPAVPRYLQRAHISTSMLQWGY